jgi:hypothetical protein
MDTSKFAMRDLTDELQTTMDADHACGFPSTRLKECATFAEAVRKMKPVMVAFEESLATMIEFGERVEVSRQAVERAMGERDAVAWVEEGM